MGTKETVTVERKYEKSGAMRDMNIVIKEINGNVCDVSFNLQPATAYWRFISLSDLNELALLRDLIDEVLEAEK